MATLATNWPPRPSEGFRVPRARAYCVFKRGLDVLVSSLAIVLCLPLFAIIALAIRLDSPGPLIYSQTRVGLDRRRGRGSSRSGPDHRRIPCPGRPFKILKFRSMVSDAENGTGAVWATKKDPRMTRVGALLRRTHLDELPQFINVLRGEMSVVGPRPERPEFANHLVDRIPGYSERCFTRPGITGLAQVKYTYDHSINTVARKLRYDLYYVRHGCLMLDLKIIAATVLVMARPADAEGS